ncbi:MAG: mechanosensitive ion channel family protein [Nitrospirales bacterium]|nr:mechanosensitive ion channel family protein [Nitrospira sp.]MDR4501723.1 mechanosensitive ion channel family protein [Nitrospirales bacterium]
MEASSLDSVKNFIEQVVVVWNAGVLGTSVGEILTAIGIFYVFLMLRHLCSRLVMKIAWKLTQRTETAIDDQLLEAVKKPLEFMFVVIGLYVASQTVHVSEAVEVVFSRIIRSLIAFTIFWGLYRAIYPLSLILDQAIGFFDDSSMHETMQEFFVKFSKFIIVCLGVAAIIQEWGFNVVALLGSLGLVGMAVALGAQDFIKNMFAGLTIFLDRMFEKGNWIQTPDIDGTVEHIGFRATKVRRFDKALVTIPNSKLANEALINFSRMTQRRIYWKIGVEYRTTREQLQDIIHDISEYVHSNPLFETDPEKTKTFVFLDSFGASSIDIMLYCFTKTTKWGEWLAVKEELAYKIKAIVEGHGTGFAFPSTSVYVETLPFGTPEAFPVPEGEGKPEKSTRT